VSAYPNPGSGQAAVSWGNATLGVSRPDVASVYGSQFTNSGYTLSVSGKAANAYLLVVSAHSTLGVWQVQTRPIYVDLATVAVTIDREGAGTGGISASGLSCAGGSSTQGLPCGASYTRGTVVTLTAVADDGSSFTGWGGACSGTGACQVTLDAARFVVAAFAKTATTYAATYYHTDAVGSVRAITDEAGNVVSRHDYLPFGEDSAPLTGDPLRFGGKQLDPETANEYFEARYLRTNWGRFLTPDPVDGNPYDPQSWNRYAYARNNPLRYTDPTGLVTFSSGVSCPEDGPAHCPGNVEVVLTDNGFCLRVDSGTCEFVDLVNPPYQFSDDIDAGGGLGFEDGTGGGITPSATQAQKPEDPKQGATPPPPGGATPPPGGSSDTSDTQAVMQMVCQPEFIDMSVNSWISAGGIGSTSLEAGFQLTGTPGNPGYVRLPRTNEDSRISFVPRPDAFGIVHTHPRTKGSAPSSQDIEMANKTGLKVFTLSIDGLYMYSPGDAKPPRQPLRPGMSWTRPCRR
jgi:RHS repeat-associated protein